MIIIPTGFYNTGSSAITHLLMEVEGVKDAESTYEIRILFDPDTIRDLEYHLVEMPHRQYTSYAIKRFKKWIDFNSNPLCNHHYEKLCKGQFRKISYEYIESLCDFISYGNCHVDVYDKGKLFWFFERCFGKIVRTFFQKGSIPSWIHTTLLRKQKLYGGTYNREKFLKATKKYIGQILDYVNTSSAEFLLLDQFVPPSGIGDYLPYFPNEDEIRVFIIDRDPRDIYTICKYYEHSTVIPTETVSDFCDWFLWTRGQSKVRKDPNCIMRLQFESLIYEYEETRKRVLDFCEINDLICKEQYVHFDPMKSINNTQVWKRYPQARNEIEKIYERLQPYCYSFEEKKIQPNFEKDNMFTC